MVHIANCCQTSVQSPDFSPGTWSWLYFPPVPRRARTTTIRTLTNLYQMEENNSSWILHMDSNWWKTTFDGRQPLMEDDFWWKKTFDGRRTLMEDNLRWKTTNIQQFDGRHPLMKDRSSQDRSSQARSSQDRSSQDRTSLDRSSQDGAIKEDSLSWQERSSQDRSSQDMWSNFFLALSRRNDPTCLKFGDCLVGVWKVFGNCPVFVWWLSGGCPEGIYGTLHV